MPDEQIAEILRGAKGKRTTAGELVDCCKEHGVALALTLQLKQPWLSRRWSWSVSSAAADRSAG